MVTLHTREKNVFEHLVSSENKSFIFCRKRGSQSPGPPAKFLSSENNLVMGLHEKCLSSLLDYLFKAWSEKFSQTTRVLICRVKIKNGNGCGNYLKSFLPIWTELHPLRLWQYFSVLNTQDLYLSSQSTIFSCRYIIHRHYRGLPACAVTDTLCGQALARSSRMSNSRVNIDTL